MKTEATTPAPAKAAAAADDATTKRQRTRERYPASADLPPWLQKLLPARPSVNTKERIRACVGALLGILGTGLVTAAALGPTASALWLIAPMGASAVLLFAVPTSPMAQPWSVIGGNLVAALIGVTCAQQISSTVPAAATAICLAIGAMFVLRCLHPPSGAVALTAVLGGAPIHAAGYGFVAIPVLLNSALILVVALLYNNMTGRSYPHSQRVEPPNPHNTADAPPMSRTGFTPRDIQAALQSYNQIVDVSIEDLEQLFRKTEAQVFRRRYGELRCADIMSRDVVTVEYATELADAWKQLREHTLHAIPVIDRARRPIGIVTSSDFLRHADEQNHRSLSARLHAFLQRTPHTHSDKHEVVGQIMHAPVQTAAESTPVAELIPLLSGDGPRQMPVVDEEGRVTGMITQTDVIAALYESTLIQPLAAVGSVPSKTS